MRPPFDCPPNAVDGALDLGGVAHVHRARDHAECQGDGLDRSKETGPTGILSIQNECNAVYARRHLFEFLQPLPAHLRFEIRKPGKIAARSRETRNKAGADGIGDPRKYNGYVLGLFPKGGQDRRAGAEDRLRRQPDEFGRVAADAVGIAGGPAVVDSNIAALHPPRFA